jgi:hypothetical protein
MTTGRINQVTTIQKHPLGHLNSEVPGSKALPPAGVHLNEFKGKAITVGPHSALSGVQASPTRQRPDHLVPRSHKIQAHFSLSSKGQRSWPSMRTTSDRQRLKGTRQLRRIPEWLFDCWVWPSASNPHPFSHCKLSFNKSKELDSERPLNTLKRSTVQSPFPSQCVLMCRRINDSVHRLPASPFIILGAY